MTEETVETKAGSRSQFGSGESKAFCVEVEKFCSDLYLVFEQDLDDRGKHGHLFFAKARGEIFQKRI